MQFKVDENIHPGVAELLRQHGHDALTVWDENLRGTADSNLAQICRGEERTIVTLDLDFADIRAYPPARHAGIIVLRLVSQSRGHVLRTVARLLPMLEGVAIAGRLWIVDEQNVRVRGDDET